MRDKEAPKENISPEAIEEGMLEKIDSVLNKGEESAELHESMASNSFQGRMYTNVLHTVLEKMGTRVEHGLTTAESHGAEGMVYAYERTRIPLPEWSAEIVVDKITVHTGIYPMVQRRASIQRVQDEAR